MPFPLQLLLEVTQPLISFELLCLLVRLVCWLKPEWTKVDLYSMEQEYVESIFLVWAQEGSICPPYVKIQIFMHFQLSVIVLSISASHFLEMTMFIS